MARAEDRVRELQSHLAAAPPAGVSPWEHYPKLEKQLEDAEGLVDRAARALSQSRGDTSALQKLPRVGNQSIAKSALAFAAANEKIKAAVESLTAFGPQRLQLEQALGSLENTIKFAGCRCVADTKIGECRLESIETGRWRARVNYLPTCTQDCARWYADPYTRVGCASRTFLANAQADWAKKKKAYDELIEKESREFGQGSAALGDRTEAYRQLDSARMEIAGEITPTATDTASGISSPKQSRKFEKPPLPPLPQ